MMNEHNYTLRYRESELIDPHILYGGDSFTWGEGLELYIDDPLWITERNNLNTWDELFDKQTFKSKEFRNLNRFPGIIEQKTNFKQIVALKNGGDYQTSSDVINLNLNENTKLIVYQFTSIDRSFLHSNIDCVCEFCNDTKPQPFYLYLDYLQHILTNKQVPSEIQKKIDYLEKYENVPKFNLNEFQKWDMDFTVYIDKLFNNIRIRNMNYFITHNIENWKRKVPVILIDSWCHTTSNMYIHSNEHLKKMLLPLKGYDGNFYTKYSEWEQTFPHRRISHEFKQTQNEHPTLLQHEYLAESIMLRMKLWGIFPQLYLV